MISIHFQGKSFNIMVIQAYAPTSNTEEAEVEWFYEDLQDLLVLTPKKSLGEGDGNPLQYSCLENPMDRGAWWAAVHEVTKRQLSE